MPSAQSRAAGNFFSLKNAPGEGGLKRKILIIGQQLSTFLLPEERLEVSSAAQVGALTGKGSVLHRLAIAAERGSQRQVQLAILPQDEVLAGTKASGTFTITGTSTAPGVLQFRINGDKELTSGIQILSGVTAAAAATSIFAELQKLINAPATFADDTLGVITATAKNKGTFGNFVSLEVVGEVPTGLSVTVSAMAGGATDPDIDSALVATGNNSANDTEIIHGYDIDGTTLDKISLYNGEGNDFVGLYQKEIGKPFRSLSCDNSKSANDWITFADARKLDRTNGGLSFPGCPAHPSELSASVIGIMARINSSFPPGLYEGEKLSWVPIPEASSRYWELGSDGGYSLRDAAVRIGVSPVIVIDGVYTLQNISTFYHPDDVDENENGWIDMSDISITQNILQYFRDLWSSSEWTGVIFVQNRIDVGTVNPDGTPLDTSKIKDRKDIITELFNSAREMASFSWLYNAEYTIEQIQANPNYVFMRANGTGFDYTFPCWYRLKGYIKNGEGLFRVGGSIAS